MLSAGVARICTSPFTGVLRVYFTECSSSWQWESAHALLSVPVHLESSSLHDKNSRRLLGSCLALSGQPSMMMFLIAVTSRLDSDSSFSCCSLSSVN